LSLIHDCAPLLLLRFFEDDDFAEVAHALALVGLRRTVTANFRSDLANFLLVDPLINDFGLRRVSTLMPSASRAPRGRETQRQIQLVALRLRAITNANQASACARNLRNAFTMFATRARIVPDIAFASRFISRCEVERAVVVCYRNKRVWPLA